MGTLELWPRALRLVLIRVSPSKALELRPRAWAERPGARGEAACRDWHPPCAHCHGDRQGGWQHPRVLGSRLSQDQCQTSEARLAITKTGPSLRAWHGRTADRLPSPGQASCDRE